MAQPSQARYDRRTILLHWATAALVLFMWSGAHAIDWFPRGSALRLGTRSLHIVVGVLLSALLAYRVFWRSSAGTVIPQPRSIPVAIAKGGHVALYVLLLATLGLGLFNTWVRGDNLFGVGRIPAFGNLAPEARQALKHQIFELHRQSANLVLIAAGLHALAAIGHRIILRDGVLQRMLLPSRETS